MRVLLAPTVTSSDRSTSTIHTESLRPLQIYPYYKRIIPSLTWIPFIPLLNLYQSAHSNVSPFSTSRCPSMMASIIGIVVYNKPTAEHQYLLRSPCHPFRTKRVFPFTLPWEYDVYVPPTRRTISVSSTRRYSVFILHPHSHKRLTHTYLSSCRIPPGH